MQKGGILCLVFDQHTAEFANHLQTIKDRSGWKPWLGDEEPRHIYKKGVKVDVNFITCKGILAYQRGDRFYNAVTGKRIRVV